jgi:hypothetical protein
VVQVNERGPVLMAGNIEYESVEKLRVIEGGGIGLIQRSSAEKWDWSLSVGSSVQGIVRVARFWRTTGEEFNQCKLEAHTTTARLAVLTDAA